MTSLKCLILSTTQPYPVKFNTMFTFERLQSDNVDFTQPNTSIIETAD